MSNNNPKILAVMVQFTLEQIDESGSIPKMKDLQPPVVVSFRLILPHDTKPAMIEHELSKIVDRVYYEYPKALEDKWNL